MTPVIFRKFKDGDIIALFPDIPCDFNIENCLSYMHVVQHSTVSLAIIKDTKPAEPDEYNDLLIELKSIGYSDLKIYKRNRYYFCERRVLYYLKSER